MLGRWGARLLALIGAGAALTAALVLGAWGWFAQSVDRPARAWPEADAIIVVSSGLTETGGLDPFSAARVETGLALWRAGRAPALLVSGGPLAAGDAAVADRMAAALIAAGAPPEIVHVERRAVSTFENARFTLEIARAQGWRRVILVTDDFHLARAAALFWWWDDGRVERVALVPARGLRDVSARVAALVLVREILAAPFNALKIAAQSGLDAVGRGGGRTIR